MQFAVWAVKKRIPAYDTSSVETMLSGISRWMEQCKRVTLLLHLLNPTNAVEVRELLVSLAKVYKKASSVKDPFTPQEFQTILFHGFEKRKLVGRHNELMLLLLGAGPLRPKVACNITVSYYVKHSAEGGMKALVFNEDSQVWINEHLNAVVISISKDKNVTAKNRRNVYIPNSFMGLKAVKILRDYILDMRMLSGSYLLAPPKSPSMFVENMETLLAGVYQVKPGGGRFFNDNPYTAAVDAVRRSAKNTLSYLSEQDLRKYGGGVPPEIDGRDAVGGGLAEVHDSGFGGLGGVQARHSGLLLLDQAPSALVHFVRAAAEVGAQGRAGEGHGAAGREGGARRARDDLDRTHLRGQRQ
jgi:hypothetical protein